MTPPLTLRPNCPMETPTAAKTMSTQLFGVLYITLMGMINTIFPNSGPFSFLGQSVSYIIKLAPILWWALPSGPAVFRPKPTNASTYAWLPETEADSEPTKKHCAKKRKAVKESTFSSGKEKEAFKQTSNNPSPPP
ncbi:hypothetical protein DSO57_1032541 [Entomophthora muscae]|uniref:Uncharacterized protein n=1 Tax=Entomophthora muscae TaxID=34485 RepID=A0ACC2UL68_9FUNG|nr:hypothetical protein DSO57_1032541 [Entomophthora muscae]